MRNGQGPKHSIFTAGVALLPLSPPFHGGEAAPDHHQRRHRSSLPPSRSRRAAGMPRATSSRMPECIQCLMEGSRRPRPHPPSVRVAACLVGRNLVDGRGGGLGCGEGGGLRTKKRNTGVDDTRAASTANGQCRGGNLRTQASPRAAAAAAAADAQTPPRYSLHAGGGPGALPTASDVTKSVTSARQGVTSARACNGVTAGPKLG